MTIFNSELLFLQHPGGAEYLEEQHGKDATAGFEFNQHSADAREQMKKYEISELDLVN